MPNCVEQTFYECIIFSSQGYGANITIRCKNSIPANAEEASNLVFQAKFIPEDTSQEYLGLKIRIFDQDGEVWFLSESPLADYDRTPDITIPSEQNFTDYSINLSAYRNKDKQKFKKFKHDGNAWGGDLVPSFGKISRITFDLLPIGTRGELLLDNIRFE